MEQLLSFFGSSLKLLQYKRLRQRVHVLQDCDAVFALCAECTWNAIRTPTLPPVTPYAAPPASPV